MTRQFGLGWMLVLWSLWFAMPSYFVLHETPITWLVIMFIGNVAFGPMVLTLAYITRKGL